MGLKRNGNFSQDLPLRFRGGRSYSFVYGETNKSQLRNIFVGGIPQNGGLNAGALPPSSWVLPQASGLIASFVGTDGTSIISAFGSMGLNASSSVSSTSTLSANGFITANLSASVDAGSDIAAYSSIVAGGESLINSTSSLSATLLAVAEISSGITSSCSITPSVSAKGMAVATISTQEELSPSSLANAVWSKDIEGDLNSKETLKVMLAALAGKISGAGTDTIFVRDITDSINRIVATVDESGNRESVIINKD